MQDSVKACIVTGYAPNTSHGSYSHGSPYAKGQERLLNSLVHHGFRHKVLAFQDFPNNHYEKKTYNIKASCMHQAREMGFDVLLWLDSSVWAIREIEPLFDYIISHGWYFHSNGFNLGRTMDNKALEYFGLTRDKAYQMPDLTSSMFGLHLGNPKAEWAFNDWLQSAKDGFWLSSRERPGKYPNDGYPEDFVGDRQDQSCLTAVMHKYEMDMVERGVYSDIAKDNANLNGHDRATIERLKQLIQHIPNGPEKKEAIELLNTLNGYSESCIFVMRGM